jgi:hypothetical protein
MRALNNNLCMASDDHFPVVSWSFFFFLSQGSVQVIVVVALMKTIRRALSDLIPRSIKSASDVAAFAKELHNNAAVPCCVTISPEAMATTAMRNLVSYRCDLFRLAVIDEAHLLLSGGVQGYRVFPGLEYTLGCFNRSVVAIVTIPAV